MPKPEGRKSIQKVKKEATHEFFNKKNSKSADRSDRTAFTFNKAPINKDEAAKEMIEGKKERPNKRSAFTAKLYKDDNELEDLKILAGEKFDSDVDESGKRPLKQRDSKAQSKSKPKQDFSSKPILTSKIGRLVSVNQTFIWNNSRSQKGVLPCLP